MSSSPSIIVAIIKTGSSADQLPSGKMPKGRRSSLVGLFEGGRREGVVAR
jgi:hypothetical protein